MMIIQRGSDGRLAPHACRSLRISAPYAFRYFIPVSHMIVTIAFPGPSCSANRKAATTFAPVDVPAIAGVKPNVTIKVEHRGT